MVNRDVWLITIVNTQFTLNVAILVPLSHGKREVLVDADLWKTDRPQFPAATSRFNASQADLQSPCEGSNETIIVGPIEQTPEAKRRKENPGEMQVLYLFRVSVRTFITIIGTA